MQIELHIQKAAMISFFIGITTAAVCVYPARVCDAVKALKAAGCTIPVASGKIGVTFVVLKHIPCLSLRHFGVLCIVLYCDFN